MPQVSSVPAQQAPVFNFKSYAIRTVMRENEPWFVARDVCAALGIRWTGHSLKGLPAAWVGMVRHTTPGTTKRGGGGNQRLRIISEPAVYKLAFRSNKPEADEFTNWVASEVLPTIRREGKYETVMLPPTQAVIPPSTPAGRAPLRALVHAWAQVSGVHYSALWPQVRAHFQLSRIDDLPVDWLPDALDFVQGKIDEGRRELQQAPALIHVGRGRKRRKSPIEQALEELASEANSLMLPSLLRFEEWDRRLNQISGPLFQQAIAMMRRTDDVPCWDSLIYALHSPKYAVRDKLDEAKSCASTACASAIVAARLLGV